MVAVDETIALVLDPGRARTKNGCFWAVAPTIALGASDRPDGHGL